MSPVGKLVNANKVDLGTNNITKVDGIGEQNTKLQTLTLSGNSISDLGTIGKVTSLVTLDLSSNAEKEEETDD